MQLFKRFTSHTIRLREQTNKRLEAYIHPTLSFFLLITLSTAIVVLGLLLNNTAIVIGGMVVAPLITPIFGFSLGLILLKIKRIFSSLMAIFLGGTLAVLVSAIISKLIIIMEGQNFTLTNEIIARAEPNLLFFLVALFSGVAGAYAYTNKNVAEHITGIAISVAIIPPLAVMGVGLTIFNWNLFEQSFFLFLLNLAGITFGSVITFVSMGFGRDIEVTAKE
ncbi:TIGR00341 family protein [Patescibacteria group bacterium]|nr:TIGR00341 family protein [Patescibacteria group bacterium]MBU1895651.1 TIGR00341 family protein [Patescibacteria group bacterium]